MMAKLIASSYSIYKWLQRLPYQEDYELRLQNKRLECGEEGIDVESQGEGSVKIEKTRLDNFIRILGLISDQPIVISIELDRLWLWQALI